MTNAALKAAERKQDLAFSAFAGVGGTVWPLTTTSALNQQDAAGNKTSLPRIGGNGTESVPLLAAKENFRAGGRVSKPMDMNTSQLVKSQPEAPQNDKRQSRDPNGKPPSSPVLVSPISPALTRKTGGRERAVTLGEFTDGQKEKGVSVEENGRPQGRRRRTILKESSSVTELSNFEEPAHFSRYMSAQDTRAGMGQPPAFEEPAPIFGRRGLTLDVGGSKKEASSLDHSPDLGQSKSPLRRKRQDIRGNLRAQTASVGDLSRTSKEKERGRRNSFGSSSEALGRPTLSVPALLDLGSHCRADSKEGTMGMGRTNSLGVGQSLLERRRQSAMEAPPEEEESAPKKKTCNIDAETILPQELFDDLLKRGREVRNKGQHVLTRKDLNNPIKLVRLDLCTTPILSRSKALASKDNGGKEPPLPPVTMELR